MKRSREVPIERVCDPDLLETFGEDALLNGVERDDGVVLWEGSWEGNEH